MPTAGITSLQTVIQGLASGSANFRILGTKHSGPVGIESIIEYRSANPIYLNVADWIDTFLVTSIDGLDGADMRTSAQQNPGEHGETPSDPLYGGRTLVMTGKQYAKTIWKLRDMQQGLRGSFMDIKHEYPLIFHAVDPADDLMIMCKLASKIAIVDQQTTRNDFQRDFQIPLRASNPRFLGAVPAGETWVLENAGPAKRMYRKSDQSNRFPYLATTSMWMLLDPNSKKNHIRFTATGLATGWNLKVIHRNTYM
jgi:hypothetical protein